MANYKFYAIKQGREPGIVTSWDECENRTQGYSGAEFKGFNDRKRAKSWLNGAGCCTKEEQQSEPGHTDPRPEAEGMAEVHIRHGEDETVWFAVRGGSVVASGLEDLPNREVAKKYILVVAVRQHGYRGNLVREERGEIADEVREKVSPLITDEQREKIKQKRRDLQEEAGSELICQDIAPFVADMLGGEAVGGKYPGEFGHKHQWVVLEDGTVVDAAADQFDEEPIKVVRPGEQTYDSYLVYDKEGHKEWLNELGPEEVFERGINPHDIDDWLVPVPEYASLPRSAALT